MRAATTGLAGSLRDGRDTRVATALQAHDIAGVDIGPGSERPPRTQPLNARATQEPSQMPQDARLPAGMYHVRPSFHPD
jgi:hypothetical protein